MKKNLSFKFFIAIALLLFQIKGNAQSLPFVLVSFTVSPPTGCTPTLNWETTGESTAQVGSMQIQRSIDQINWIQIKTIQGGHPSVQTYSYVDANPYDPSHTQVYYRIAFISSVSGQCLGYSPIELITSNCTGSLNILCSSSGTITGLPAVVTQNQSFQLSLVGITPQTVSWSSSNPTVATVATITTVQNNIPNPGLVTVQSSGMTSNYTIITATLGVCGQSYSQAIVMGSTTPLINGAPGYTFYFPPNNTTYGSGYITATPGKIVTIIVSTNEAGTGNSSLQVSLNGVNVTNNLNVYSSNPVQSSKPNTGPITQTFTMPASGYVTWTATFTQTLPSNGLGGITVK